MCHQIFLVSVRELVLIEATTMMDINTVMISLLAFLFLDESIGLRRIIGILVSLSGATVIIRPATTTLTNFLLMLLLFVIYFAV